MSNQQMFEAGAAFVLWHFAIPLDWKTFQFHDFCHLQLWCLAVKK